MDYKKELYRYLRDNRDKQIDKEAEKHAYTDLEIDDPINISAIERFSTGAIWADQHPSIETLLKVFYMFDKHGLFRDDLCFDPHHFIETVIIPNFNRE